MPKTIYTKEQLVKAAFEIVCEAGFDQLTIRNVARRLGSSIAPIYVNFKDVEELKQAVISKAVEINKEILAEQNSGDPFLDVGIASVLFAKRYPRIFDEIVIKNDQSYRGQTDNEMFVINQMKNDPQLAQFKDEDLRLLLLKMQALQAGLSLLARKEAYKDLLDDDMIIKILDHTGLDILDGMSKRSAEHGAIDKK